MISLLLMCGPNVSDYQNYKAYGESDEERVNGGIHDRGYDGGSCGENHRSNRPGGADCVWLYNGKGERQEYTAATKSHGKIVPE